MRADTTGVLVIKCHSGSRIHIGDDITVTVDAVVDGDACLSVDCPTDLLVWTSAEARLYREAHSQARTLGTGRRRVISTRTPPDLLIGSSVRVSVLPASGTTIRIGIDAPRGLTVTRQLEDADPEIVLT